MITVTVTLMRNLENGAEVYDDYSDNNNDDDYDDDTNEKPVEWW